MRVLVVEDSEKLRRSLVTALRRTGYAVDETGDGKQGHRLATSVEYDLIVLDLMLPGMDGMSVLQRLRTAGNKTHVLVLTAKDSIDDRVRGLHAGADDYLIKPFALQELLARVNALGRRSADQKNPLISLGPITINTSARTVMRGGKTVMLTAREFSLLEYLVVRRGTVISRTEIEAHIYDSMVEPMSNVVDSTVCAIRRKLDPDEGPSLVETRRGMGYMISDDIQ
ncbi:response regulator transcription factor [soil metagenome]